MQSRSCFPDVNALVKLKRVIDVVAAPCGSWAAVVLEYADEEGSRFYADLWKVALDGSAQAWQLTRGNSRDHSPCFTHDGALAFLSNRPDPAEAGASTPAEYNQIWQLGPHGGDPERLTDEPLGVKAFRCASQTARMVWLTQVWPGVPHTEQREFDQNRRKHGPSGLRYTSMPVRYWDHWLPGNATHLVVQDQHGRRDLTPNASRELEQASFDLSANGRYCAITWRNEGSDRAEEAGLMLFDLETDAPDTIATARLLGHETHAELSKPLFSPDGSRILCQIESRIEQACPVTALRLIDLASGVSQPLAAAWNYWPTPQAWHQDGDSVFVTAHDNGCTPVFQIELSSGDIVRLTESGSHDKINCIMALHDTGNPGIIGIHSGFTQPPEVFHSPLMSSDLYLPTACLSGFDPALADMNIENASVISSDQHPVQYWLLSPTHIQQPSPILLWIHGGPLGAWQDEWHWRWNALLAVAQGFAVLMPNPRGSTGFGQAFCNGVWCNQWGRQCYEDILAVLDQVSTRHDLDSSRMAAMGGSFGGYMTNWLGTQTRRFQCLISHASIYSMSAFTGVTDMPAHWYLQMDGEPYSDPGWFDRYSPSRGIHKWRTPTLVIHGEQDYRVPISEALALFEALQYHKVESELLVFPDENHWICKPNNIIAWYQAVFEFLHRYTSRKNPE